MLSFFMLGGGCWDFWIVPALAHGEEPDSSSTFQPLLRLFVFFPELLHLNLWWNLVSFSFSFRFSPGRLLPKVSTFALFSPLFQFSDGKVGKRCFFQKKKKTVLEQLHLILPSSSSCITIFALSASVHTGNDWYVSELLIKLFGDWDCFFFFFVGY